MVLIHIKRPNVLLLKSIGSFVFSIEVLLNTFYSLRGLDIGRVTNLKNNPHNIADMTKIPAQIITAFTFVEYGPMYAL